MIRQSVAISGDLEQAIEAYRRDQDIPPGLSAMVRAALREYLAGRGYLEPRATERRPEALWPRYPLYGGDPGLAERADEELSGAEGGPAFGER